MIDCRPSDLLEPQFKKRKEELEEMGLLKKPEDVLTYAIYPQVGLKFLKGEAKAEFTSDQLPLKPKPIIQKPSFTAPRQYLVQVDKKPYEVEIQSENKFIIDGTPYEVLISEGARISKAPPKEAVAPIDVTSPMLGTILQVEVKVGERVKKGQVIATLEAMKMESEILSPADGVVKSVEVNKGQGVEAGALIARIGS